VTDSSLRWRAFWGLFLRDFAVLRRQFVAFLIRTIMNPLLFVFVFTYLFPKMGQGFQSSAGVSFGTLILPGLLAIGIFIQGIMATALPLSMEIGATREIHDRVMSPLPVSWVAMQKIVFSGLQSILAAVVIFPLVYFIPVSPVQIHIYSWPMLIAVLVLASLVSGAVGLFIGTSVQPQHIALMFGIVVVPVSFLGCVYYPWAAMHNVRWLQVLVLVNPVVYMSEGLRTTLTPSLPHMPAWVTLLALTVSLVVLGWFGMKGFLRRVLS
jgi:ABC-2 type transport system permease protein